MLRTFSCNAAHMIVRAKKLQQCIVDLLITICMLMIRTQT